MKKNMVSIFIILTTGFLGWYLLNNNKDKGVDYLQESPEVIVLQRDSEGRSTDQIRKSDFDCKVSTEDAGPDSIDPTDENVYVVEHVYYGNLKEGQPVQIILSCDQERFTITGAVKQVIDINDTKMFPDLDMFNALADIASGSGVVYLEDDYNFDGYNDLHTISSNGQGWDGVDSVNIFLYDPVVQKFVFNTELSKLQNVLPPDYENKFIFEDFSYYNGKEHVEAYRKHKWVNGHLVKIEE